MQFANVESFPEYLLVGFSERALGLGIRDGHQAGFFFYKRPTRVFVDGYAVIGHLETHRTGAYIITLKSNGNAVRGCR